MNDKVEYESLTICAASDKGHFVYEGADDTTRGAYRPILFAGDLEQCLEWVRSRIRD
jgi:hypothetical protein